MKELLEDGYRVLLETSGERPLERVPGEVIKIVDVKCPNSGEGGTFLLENLATLTARDEVKFVLSDRTDYEFAREFTRQHNLAERVNCRTVLAGVPQRCHGSAGQFALLTRSPRISGVDVGR